MTQEEKARAYDEALEVMRQWIAPCHTKEQLDALKKSVFPELAESEEEQALRIIRKRMCYDPAPISDEDRRIVETWLEKQKEQKPAECAPDSVLQKIKRAITDCKSLSEHYKDTKENFYQYYGGKAEGLQLALTYFTNENEQLPEEQKSAECLKAERDGWYVCIKDYYRGGKKQSSVGDLVQAKGGMFMMGEEDISEWFRRAYYEEVRDAFEPNADANTPEKPLEWSEEDETHRDFILELLEDQVRFCKKNAEGAYYANQIRTAQNWLKALPLRIKKNNEDTAKLCSNEWSEEDERMLERAFHIIVEYSDIDEKESEVVQNWLKSFRERTTFDDASGI